MIKQTEHVFDCKAGNVSDLVIAPTRDAAEAKFKKITSINGKEIKVQVNYLFTVPETK